MGRSHPGPFRALARFGIAAALISIGATAGAHGQHAHMHGRLSLDVAVDAGSITIEVETPLDNLLGFERAPRTDAERRRIADALARLNAADRLFMPDPAAGCQLSKVSLNSAVLGIGRQAVGTDAGGTDAGGRSKADSRDRAGHGEPETHADLDATIVFACTRADLARFIDVKLFEQFKRLRSVEAQVAAPQGQFKRTLNAKAPRLSWGR